MSQSFPEFETIAEPQNDQHAHQPHPDGAALAVSADDFSALEERIVRAVEVVKQERSARAAAEDRAAKAEEQVREQTSISDRLHKELEALRAERDHIRQRVERLLTQLDAIEL
jgi:dynactin complex subunit